MRYSWVSLLVVVICVVVASVSFAKDPYKIKDLEEVQTGPATVAPEGVTVTYFEDFTCAATEFLTVEHMECLIAEVENLVAKGALSRGSSKGLIAKLKEAIKNLNKGKDQVALNKLYDFSDQVQALMNSGGLSLGHGQRLIFGAQPLAGWEPQDLTTQKGVFWHHDSAERVMECSTEDAGFVASPGYGDLWNQLVEKTFTIPAIAVTLEYTIAYSTETNYDFVYVDISEDGGPFETIEILEGYSGGFVVRSYDIPPGEPAPSPALPGVCYASTGFIDGGNLLTIDLATGVGTLLGPSGLDAVPGLAINSEGEIFGTEGDTGDLYRIDAAAGEAHFVAATGINYLDGIAFDENDVLYGVAWDPPDYTLLTIDTETGAVTPIGPTGDIMTGLAFDPADGQLYGSVGGFDPVNPDGIYRIDKTTGAATLLGATGFGRATPDLYFDADGNMYGIKGGGQSPNNLIAIDKTTGAGSVVGSIGFSAVSGLAGFYGEVPPPAGEGDRDVTVRLRFTSDLAWSDEDGLFLSGGFACQLDRVRLFGTGAPVVFADDDFDAGPDGWVASAAPPVGGGPFRLEGVANCSLGVPCNPALWPNTESYVAYDTDTGVFPFTSEENLALGFVINIAVESPVFEIPVDAGSYRLAFDVYRDLPLFNGVFYTWEVAAPPPEEGGSYKNANFIYYGTGGLYRASFDVTNLVAPGATSMRIRLSGLEEGPRFGFPSDTHTAAPFFDNVAVTVTGTSASPAPGGGIVRTNLPLDFSLMQNHPNPFNPTTTIQFALPEQTQVTLTIFDVSGRKVRTLVNESRAANRHSVVWDGRDDRGQMVGSGVYFYKLDAGSFTQTRKMMRLNVLTQCLSGNSHAQANKRC